MENKTQKAIKTLHTLKTGYDSRIDDANTGELFALEAINENTACSEACKLAIAALEQQENNKGCNICNSDEIEKLLIIKRLNMETLAFVGGNSKFPKENHAKFCPKCGRKLEG